VVLDFVDPDGDGSTSIALERRQLYSNTVDQILAQENLSESISSADRVYWPLTDQLGTVRDLVGNDRALAEHYEYDSYGNVTAGDTTLTRYLFTGRELDIHTGLQNNRARWYDAATGRWINQDPLGFAAGDTNLARYVGNQATTLTDPSGLEPPEYSTQVPYTAYNTNEPYSVNNFPVIYSETPPNNASLEQATPENTPSWTNEQWFKDWSRQQALPPELRDGSFNYGSNRLNQQLYEDDLRRNGHSTATIILAQIFRPGGGFDQFTSSLFTVGVGAARRGTTTVTTSKWTIKDAVQQRDWVISLMQSKYSKNKVRDFSTVVAGIDSSGRIIVKAKSRSRYGDTLCSEDLILRAFQNDPGTTMTPAFRPRTGELIPVCPRCRSKYPESMFPFGYDGDK
jgi:RHS repeat-associated protein